MGPDLESLYRLTRQKLVAAYHKKIDNPGDGKKVNPRVAYEALTGAAFTGTDVAAEYFMGALASSRSPDGDDDSAIQFVATLKAMSSSQLRLHYFIYRALNRILVESERRVNVPIGHEFNKENVYFFRCDLTGPVLNDLVTLYNRGLISSYNHKGSAKPSYVEANPTDYGVQLFATAHNKLIYWDVFDRFDFGDFEGLSLPRFAPTLEELYALEGNPTQ